MRFSSQKVGRLFSAVAPRMASTYVEGFHNAKAVHEMHYRDLGETGLQVSALGYGSGALGGFYGDFHEEDAIKSVHTALRNGVNFIDTAPWYGDTLSEQVLGKALKTVPREAYYIATKVGRYKPQIDKMFDFSAETTSRSIEQSLQRLGVDYIDLIQVHDAEFAGDPEIVIKQTLPALEKARQQGLVKFIGITGYDLPVLMEIARKSPVKLDTFLSFCRFGVFNNDLANVIPELKQRGLGVINASPIGMGLLSEKGPPQWHPAPEELKTACKQAVLHAKEKGVDLAKVALKHCFEYEDISTTLVSMERADLVELNLKSFREPMSKEEEQVRQEVTDRFFAKLPKTHWEGVEAAKHQKKLAALKT